MSGEGMIPMDSAWGVKTRLFDVNSWEQGVLDHYFKSGGLRGIMPTVTHKADLQALMDTHVRFRDELREHLASGRLGDKVDLMVNAALERVDEAIKRGSEEYGLEATP